MSMNHLTAKEFCNLLLTVKDCLSHAVNDSNCSVRHEQITQR